MPNYISQIQLPSGGSYEIKDAWARNAIGQIVSIKFIVAWNGTGTPDTSKLPDIITIRVGSVDYPGQLTPTAADKGAFYLVYSQTQYGSNDVYDEYVAANSGTESSPTYVWEKVGDTSVSFGQDVVLGESTTFTNSSSTVSFSGGTTDVVLGEATTFTASGTAVGKTTKYLSASASGTAVGANGTASAVTGYPNATTATAIDGFNLTSGNLVTDTVDGLSTTGSASTWSFTMGIGNNSETLIISGTNSVAPTVTQKTFATGAISSDGTGDTVVKNVTAGSSHTHTVLASLGSPSTATVLTGVKVTAQPSVTLTANSTTATGRITYVESLGTVTQPTIAVGTNDKVTAIKTLGTATAAAQTITVGTNDKVTVLTPGT